MSTRTNWVATLIAMSLLTAPTIHAQTILLDDFQQGIDPNWFAFDTNYELDATGMPVLDAMGMPIPRPWGPGVFDPSSQALNLRTAGPVPDNPALPDGPEIFDTLNSGLVGLGWGPSVDPGFSNGRLRATVRVDNPSNVDLVLRADPVTISAYVFAALGSYGEFHFSRLDNGVIAFSTPVPGLTFTQGEDWVMEFGAVGNEFSMKAWRLGELEPVEPQFTAIDDTYAFGSVGITASVSTNNISAPTPVDATFDDIYFTPVPEPASLFFAAILLLLIAALPLRERAR